MLTKNQFNKVSHNQNFEEATPENNFVKIRIILEEYGLQWGQSWTPIDIANLDGVVNYSIINLQFLG